MAAKEISVKRYVVRLSGEERERLETLGVDLLPTDCRDYGDAERPTAWLGM